MSAPTNVPPGREAATLLFRNPRLLGLLVFVILALGASSLISIGRQEDPTITNLFATVITPFPGADPARVESLVTEKIEAELQRIPEIDKINSLSRTGISIIRISLSQYLPEQNLEQIWSEIRDALRDASRQFPPGVPDPEFDNDRTGAFTIISAVRAREGRTVSAAILRRAADRLQDRLRQLPDTALVSLFGDPEEEVRVTLDPALLAARGLSFAQVSAAIAAADAKVRAGQVRGAANDLVVELDGEIRDLGRVAEIVVATGPDGQVVRVGDLGQVARTERDPPASLALADGRPAILIAARMEPDRQVDVWSARIRQELAAFEASLPAGLEHKLLFDQSRYTQKRFAELGDNLLQGMIGIMIVLFFVLGWRAALVVSLSIPLTAILCLPIMLWAGIPLHQMSVTGLIVGMALMVDAAVVMTDEIHQFRTAGARPAAAVGGAIRRLALPLSAGITTTVLSFLPMSLLPGPAGDFVGSIANAVIIMLVSSVIVALTVTPALAGWLVRPPGERRRWWRDGVDFGGVARAFRATIGWSLRHRRIAIALALILPMLGFFALMSGRLTNQFFPAVDRDQFYIQLWLPGGSSLAMTEAATRRAEATLRGDPDLVSVHWVMGESAPPFYYNMIQGQDGAPNFAEALVTTTDEVATRRAIPRAQAALDEALPGVQVVVRELAQGPPVAAPIEVRIVGPDLDGLKRVGEQVRAILARVPNVVHTRADLKGGEPLLRVYPDEDRLRATGLDLAQVARQLEGSLEGAVGGSLLEGSEELPVRVRLGDAAGRADPEAVASLDIVPPGGVERMRQGTTPWPAMPLGAIGDVRLVPSESPIARYQGERVNVVQGFLAQGVLPEEALRVFQRALTDADLALPAGFRIEYGGDADARAETIRNLISTLGLVVILTIVTIVLTFRSYRLAAIGFAVCGLSFGSAILALFLGDYPFGIQALIGAIGSIGVSINACIIILTGMQEEPAALSGDRRAIADVVLSSSRHITTTTISNAVGFLPLILEGGGFWPPFAVAIAGGMILATIVSFYFVPPLYSLLIGRRGERTAQAGGIPSAAAVPPGGALAAAAE